MALFSRVQAGRRSRVTILADQDDLRLAAGSGAGRPSVILAALIAAVLTIIIVSGEARAHVAYVFAWVEGDQVCTNSYFGAKNPIRSGKVVIKSADGAEVGSGVTDAKGDLCLPRPQVEGDLTIDLEAGDDHNATFTLRAEDMPPLGASQ